MKIFSIIFKIIATILYIISSLLKVIICFLLRDFTMIKNGPKGLDYIWGDKWYNDESWNE